MVADEAPQPGAFDTHEEAGTTVLALSGRLDTEAAAALWPLAFQEMLKQEPHSPNPDSSSSIPDDPRCE
jgi:hypothetical protein